MATMFGRFEIQSEISNSETARIYKAIDTETNQTVALKTQSLEPLGEGAATFVDSLLEEGEHTRDLGCQNIALLYGAGEIDGQFCAAMEYVQGNSIATMLARKEGFSIWDLVDITRQVCAALDHAASKEVVHHSLEPAKIMVQWDGLVKMLGYGISNMSLIEAEAGHGLGRLMPYCAPEQVRGEPMDLRSNLFTWGAILYEMVTGRKAFDASDPGALVAQIQNEMPPSPSSLNQKIQPGVSDLIMKALAKDPAARHQTARELVADIEKSKDSGKKVATEAKKAAAPAFTVSAAARAEAASKFVSAARNSTAAMSNGEAKAPEPEIETFSAPPNRTAEASFSAAAASAGGAHPSPAPESGARMIEAQVQPSPHERPAATPLISVASAEPATETHTSRFTVDPMMAGGAQAGSGKSFSDIDELPPLKEMSSAPAPPVCEAPEPAVMRAYPKTEETPRIQRREVAKKAVIEIKTIPPQLMMYAILGAVALISIVSAALYFHVRSEDDLSTAAPRPIKTATATEEVPPVNVAPQPVNIAPQSDAPAPEPAAEPEVTVRHFGSRATNTPRRPRARAQVAVIPGQIQVDSNPQGAQIQVDGKSDPSWVTPFNLTGVVPGKHLLLAGKTGYLEETRSVEVVAGSKSFVVLQLPAANALMIVNSTPAGAEIVIDGKSTGRVTPAQLTVEKGSHSLMLRKQGYLEESASADLAPGQNFQFAPALRPLGNADDIRTVGKFKKLFGNGRDSVEGMGAVSIRTRPKGAQIALNQHLLDKPSPVEIMMGPGAYVLDITLTGFKPVHKVITVEKGGKAAVDEILERQ